MSAYECSFRIYIIFYHMRPFNKTTATLVRPHPISTLCTTPLGKMWVCELHPKVRQTCYQLHGSSHSTDVNKLSSNVSDVDKDIDIDLE